MNALIGSTGFIGSVLKECISFDSEFNSKNIEKITEQVYATVYCAAPTGSRVFANNNPDKDLANIQRLISILKGVDPNTRFILVGTVDSVHATDTTYGSNRQQLECFVRDYFKDHYIVRLPSIIHKSIKKNILHDLKHQQWLDKICQKQVMQWYSLHNICQDLEWIFYKQCREVNLVSEPVCNQDIIGRYSDTSVGNNNTPGKPYNLVSLLKDKDYINTKEQIFQYMDEYFDN